MRTFRLALMGYFTMLWFNFIRTVAAIVGTLLLLVLVAVYWWWVATYIAN